MVSFSSTMKTLHQVGILKLSFNTISLHHIAVIKLTICLWRAANNRVKNLMICGISGASQLTTQGEVSHLWSQDFYPTALQFL